MSLQALIMQPSVTFTQYISTCLFTADPQQTTLQTSADTSTSYRASTRTVLSSQKRVQYLTAFSPSRVTLSSTFVVSENLLQTAYVRPEWLRSWWNMSGSSLAGGRIKPGR